MWRKTNYLDLRSVNLCSSSWKIQWKSHLPKRKWAIYLALIKVARIRVNRQTGVPMVQWVPCFQIKQNSPPCRCFSQHGTQGVVDCSVSLDLPLGRCYTDCGSLGLHTARITQDSQGAAHRARCDPRPCWYLPHFWSHFKPPFSYFYRFWG